MPSFLSPDAFAFFNEYEDAFIGVAHRYGMESVVAYDYDKIISILQERDKMTYDIAVEHFDFNIIGSWVGDRTPLFIEKCQIEQLQDF